MHIDGAASRPSWTTGARAAGQQPAAAARTGAGRQAEYAVPVRGALRGGRDDAGPAAAPWLAQRLVEGAVEGPRMPHARGVAAYPTLAATLELFAPGETIAMPVVTARPLIVRVA